MIDICLIYKTTRPRENVSRACTIKSNRVLRGGNIFSLQTNMGADYFIPCFPELNLNNIYIALTDGIPGKIYDYYTGISLTEIDMIEISCDCLIGKGKYAHIQDNSLCLYLNDESFDAIFQVVKELHINTSDFGRVPSLVLERIMGGLRFLRE